MIEAFTRLDNEILAIETLSPGSRLTTAEAWVDHLENMHLKVDETMDDRHSSTMDAISEIDEVILDDKLPPSTQQSLDRLQTSHSTLERERNDIMKVKKVCKCSFDWCLRCIVKINLFPLFYVANKIFSSSTSFEFLCLF